MEITPQRLQQIIAMTVDLTTKKVLTDLGLLKKNITQNQAEKVYGKKNIAIWRETKDIKPVKIGNRIYYDRAKLDELSLTNKLIS